MAKSLSGRGSRERIAPPPWGTTQVLLSRLVALLVLIGIVVVAFALQAAPGRGAPAAMSILIGAALGFVFECGRFCFFCILRDFFEYRNSTAIYAILAALAVGTIGYALVFGVFLPNAGAGRLPPNAHIGPVSWVLVLAGLAFGVGMALSGACISGHLYRLGEGSMRAPWAIAGSLLGFGLGFYTWNSLYLATIVRAPVVWLPAHLGYSGATALQLIVLAGIAVALLRWLPELPAREARKISLRSIYDSLFGKRWNPLITGALVGLIGVFAYFRVGPLGVTAQLGSLSRTWLFNAGFLPERLHGLDTFAGCATKVVQTITDNGFLITSLIAGSLVAALISGRFKPDKLTVRGASSALAGGVLMGWGSMSALGCTVGVLLSGISAFALSGWVFAATMLVGVWLGIRFGLHRFS
jgi:uncharacterized membrane protein YedE/YeeE